MSRYNADVTAQLIALNKKYGDMLHQLELQTRMERDQILQERDAERLQILQAANYKGEPDKASPGATQNP